MLDYLSHWRSSHAAASLETEAGPSSRLSGVAPEDEVNSDPPESHPVECGLSEEARS